MSPWSSAPSGNDPWPPEPWQPEPVRQDRQAGPPQDDRPWGAHDDEHPWSEPPQERSWNGPPQERPWGEHPQERPWGEHPQEQPWSGRPQGRPWEEPPQEQSWGGRPGEPRPWSDGPQEHSGEQRWGSPPQGPSWDAGQGDGRPWSGGPEPQRPPRADGEQWLPDDGPRWRGPLVAGLVAALLTAAVVVGYVFWSGDDDSESPSARPGTVQDGARATTAPPETGQGDDPSVGDDPQAQAQAVDSLLGDMSSSRKKLANITYTCANKARDVAAFKTAVQEREGQLADADELSLGSLKNGAEIKNALLDALQASIDSNREALTWLEDEDGCDKDAAARLKDVNDRATATKRTFLDLWNPVATEQGLQTWTRENI